MNLLIIDRSDSWHVEDLVRAANGEHTIDTATYDELSVALNEDQETSTYLVKGIPVQQYDAILTRAMPASSLEQIVFRMDWLNQVETQLRIPVVNPAKTIESSIDKYLSLEKMRAFELPVPKTHVSQSTEDAFEFFTENGCDSVVKPIFGSRGRSIYRIQSHEAAQTRFAEIAVEEGVIYQQEYIEHGDSDLRLLVIGDNVIGMNRCRPGQWISNASLGAICITHNLTVEEHRLAVTAAHSQDAIIAGIDLVYRNEQPFIIEINACPAWNHIAETTTMDVSRTVLNVIAGFAVAL